MNRWTRQFHRWLSIIFTVIVALLFAAPAIGTPPQWLYYVPLLPLALLALTGLYLFVLPYLARRRATPAE